MGRVLPAGPRLHRHRAPARRRGWAGSAAAKPARRPKTARLGSRRPLPRHRPLGVGRRLQRVRRPRIARSTWNASTPRGSTTTASFASARSRHFRDGTWYRSRISRVARRRSLALRGSPCLKKPHRAGDNRGRCPWRNAQAPPIGSSQRASATWPAASRRRRSSWPAPKALGSGTSTAASSSTSPAGSPARTSATARRPSSPRSTSRSTATSTSASWSGRTSRTWSSAAGSTSSGPAIPTRSRSCSTRAPRRSRTPSRSRAPRQADRASSSSTARSTGARA